MPTPQPDTAGTVDDARSGAYIIDFALLGLASGIVWMVVVLLVPVVAYSALGRSPAAVVGVPSGVFEAVLRLLAWAVVTALLVGYFAVYQCRRDRTPGKRVTDVMVVGADGRPADMRQHAVRTGVLLAPLPVQALSNVLLDFRGFFVGLGLVLVWLGVEWTLVKTDPEGRRLGDRLARTRVVAAE